MLLSWTAIARAQWPGSAAVESGVVEGTSKTFGTLSPTVLTIGMGSMVPPNSSVTYATTQSAGGGVGIFQTAAPTVNWWTSFHLPNGAILDRVDMEACDFSNTGELYFAVVRGAVPAGAIQTFAAGGTGVQETPGCAFFQITPTSSNVIANDQFNYWIFFGWLDEYSVVLSVRSFRVRYRLQVSAAPAVATFPNDVPTTHPFFRFVEALAAAGITAGCAPESYCPNNPVTRGEMAVFLAAALGLHFPN
ncbi:MAG TPA: S-layer homology domain-containing protein [Thermoanaerobaculia bacterium]|jgi:hypothetical protein